MYKLLKTSHENPNDIFVSKWISKLKVILNTTGHSYVWLEQSNVNPVNCKYLQTIIKQKVNDISKQNLLSDINNNTQCSIYRIIKTDLQLEPYLTRLDNRSRIILCKFRCRNHKLPCVTVRFSNIIDRIEKF